MNRPERPLQVSLAKMLFIKHDVTKAEDWSRVVKEGEAKFGTITILVNNAGVLGPNFLRCNG